MCVKTKKQVTQSQDDQDVENTIDMVKSSDGQRPSFGSNILE